MKRFISSDGAQQTFILPREEIIRALEEEPLAARSWVTERTIENPNCHVCAVGAVLRDAGFSNWMIDDSAGKLCRNAFGAPYDVNQLLPDMLSEIKRENFLGALSIYFEGLFDKECTDRSQWAGSVAQPPVREKLVAFVLEHFPAEIEIRLPVDSDIKLTNQMRLLRLDLQ